MTDGSRAKVDNGTFSNIGRYTQFAGAAYSEDCPSIPFGATVLQTWNQSDTDIKAILFQDSKANEVILSFRGSATPKNLDQDLLFTLVNVNLTGVTAASCSGCQVHTGFQSALQPIQAGILSAIKATNAGGFFGPKLTVTGHSLGAGLASLAAGSLVGSGLSVNAVYTFGEPRNGNPAWSKYMNGKFSTNYFRVTHYNDGVPQIPPQILGYQHHGTEYWESLENANTASTTLACLGQEPAVSAYHCMSFSGLNARLTYKLLGMHCCN